MTSGGGRSMSYTAFNVPSVISNSSTTQSFAFDPEHNRISQVETSSLAGAAAGTTLYLNGGGILCERFTNSSTGVVTWRNYIVADGETKALVNQTANTAGPNWGAFNWEMAGQPGARNWTSSITATAILYLHSDHLGSIAAITNSSAALSEQDAYDPWGKRRNLNGTDDTLDTLTSQTTRGYTDQEELTDVALLHLNGRIYDPQLGKFTSGDPMVGQPFGTQGWNRYSYVGNNPLAYSDASGMCFLGCFWKSPVFRAVVAIAVAATGQLYGLPALEGTTFAELTTTSSSLLAVNAGIAGAAAGAISTGSFKGALIGALTADANFEVGSLTADSLAANIAGHAALGCVSAAASGGSCGSGALSGGFAAAAGPLVQNQPWEIAVTVSSLTGGVGSVLGGGKFENGAITGAFAYLFNQMLHPTDIGNDAHETLLNAARESGENFFGNTWRDPLASTWFGGRPDLGDTTTFQIWEVKPILYSIDAAIQVEYYSIVSGISGQQYDPGNTPPSFFQNNSISLAGKYGFYNYTFEGAGVIGYTSQLNPQVNIVPQIIPLIGKVPRASPFETLKGFPELVPP